MGLGDDKILPGRRAKLGVAPADPGPVENDSWPEYPTDAMPYGSRMSVLARAFPVPRDTLSIEYQ